VTEAVAPRGSLLSGKRLVVVDTETSGWSLAAGHAVIEIACVTIEDGVPRSEWSTLVRPRVPVEPGARMIHGIDDAELADAPPPQSVAPMFVAACGRSPLVFHHAAFDLPFLQSMVTQSGIRALDHPVIDTLGLARGLLGTGSNDLETLGTTLGVGEHIRHRALPDARTTARLLVALVPRWERERGTRSLAELAAASQDVVRATSKRPADSGTFATS
jgi:DNA polymerase III epsilon subunit-like protein